MGSGSSSWHGWESRLQTDSRGYSSCFWEVIMCLEGQSQACTVLEASQAQIPSLLCLNHKPISKLSHPSSSTSRVPEKRPSKWISVQCLWVSAEEVQAQRCPNPFLVALQFHNLSLGFSSPRQDPFLILMLLLIYCFLLILLLLLFWGKINLPSYKQLRLDSSKQGYLIKNIHFPPDSILLFILYAALYTVSHFYLD